MWKPSGLALLLVIVWRASLAAGPAANAEIATYADYMAEAAAVSLDLVKIADQTAVFDDLAVRIVEGETAKRDGLAKAHRLAATLTAELAILRTRISQLDRDIGLTSQNLRNNANSSTASLQGLHDFAADLVASGLAFVEQAELGSTELVASVDRRAIERGLAEVRRQKALNQSHLGNHEVNQLAYHFTKSQIHYCEVLENIIIIFTDTDNYNYLKNNFQRGSLRRLADYRAEIERTRTIQERVIDALERARGSSPEVERRKQLALELYRTYDASLAIEDQLADLLSDIVAILSSLDDITDFDALDEDLERLSSLEERRIEIEQDRFELLKRY